jgi:hypothetical protein
VQASAEVGTELYFVRTLIRWQPGAVLEGTVIIPVKVPPLAVVFEFHTYSPASEKLPLSL